MRRLARPVALALALCLSLPAVADKANSAYKHGRDAEARQDYDTAYQAYKEAYDLNPKDIRYRSAYTRARFYASSAHVHKGQQLREQGKLQEALAEFDRAAQIDPSNFIAAQEAKATRNQIQKSTVPSSQAPPSNPVSQLAQSARGPVELKPISTQPINLRMFEDAKVVYSTVGKLAGVNVLFDPDYTSRRIQIELNNVSLEQALEIIALESRTFWRPVTSNTIFVAADNAAKRRELEQSVVKVFYLSNVSSANDLQDAVSVVRTVAAVQSVQPVASQDALVIRGTPDQVALAESLLSSIDKAKPEVIVEVAVMQVTRDRMRQLGIQPFNTAQVALQPNATTTTTNQSGQVINTPTTTTGLTLNKLANLNAQDFQVTISPANLAFLMNDSNTRVIQNPQIRALDNQKATLKIGDKVPVATGSFQPGIGGVGINPLVNTQFQYLDVGVNIEITPRIHSDAEVTLKMGLEISSVTGSSNIGGISQPIIGQRRIEHEIRLKEGEVNLLGGILEDSETKSLSGWPFISKVPILKYLFSLENRDHRENEIVFALVPHIVRRLDVTEQNLRPIDVGTYSTIELRRESSGAVPVTPPGGGPTTTTQSAPQATQVPAVQPPNQAGSQTPAQQAQAGLASGNAVLSFEPAQITQPLSSTFAVNVSLNGAQDAYSVPLEISYPHEILQLLNVSNGGFLERDNQPVTLVHREDPGTGTLQITATRPPGSGGLSGSGTVVTLTFLAKRSGQGTLNIVRGSLRDPAMQAKPVAGGQAMVTVK